MKIEELEERLWTFLLVPGFKGHFCPRSLVGGMLSDLQARVSPEYDGCILEPREGGIIDLPGMIMIDRPMERIRIDTFDLDIPSQDSRHFAMELYGGPKRKLGDGREYYKIHGGYVCMVLTVEQRDLVLTEMNRMLPEAKKRGEQADAEFSRRMRTLREKGVDVISHRDKEDPRVRRVRRPRKEKN